MVTRNRAITPPTSFGRFGPGTSLDGHEGLCYGFRLRRAEARGTSLAGHEGLCYTLLTKRVFTGSHEGPQSVCYHGLHELRASPGVKRRRELMR